MWFTHILLLVDAFQWAQPWQSSIWSGEVLKPVLPHILLACKQQQQQ